MPRPYRSERSDAAVRLRGRDRKTGFGENDRIIKFQETHKGGENHGHKNHAKAVKADQRPHQKALLQLYGRQLPSVGRRRRTRLCAVHQPVRDLLQLFQKCSPSSRQCITRRNYASDKQKAMPNLQNILHTKSEQSAVLLGLCRHPKAEESRRAPAQETDGSVSGGFQGTALTSY